MEIEYLGHSCFKLTESTGVSVVTDPYSREIGYRLPKVSADIVTSSHGHYDHANISEVGGGPLILKEPVMIESGGITVTGIKSFHDDKKGARRGENIIFKFRMDGIDVCHLGDIGHECTSELVEMLLPVNVLLIPVGGKYTIDANEAYEYVEKLMPDIVIPMHYKTRSLNLDIDKVNDFISKFEEEDVEQKEESVLELDRNDLDSSSTRVVVLKRRKTEEEA